MSPIQVHDVNITISPVCCNNDSCPSCCGKKEYSPAQAKVNNVAMEVIEVPDRVNAPDVTKEIKKKKCCVIL